MDIKNKIKYTVTYTDNFERSLECLMKNYFHPKFEKSLLTLAENLANGIFEGDKIPNLNFKNSAEAFKLRIANPAANKGKSGGFRIIYYVVMSNKEIYILDIYSKSKKTDITGSEIEHILSKEGII